MVDYAEPLRFPTDNRLHGRSASSPLEGGFFRHGFSSSRTIGGRLRAFIVLAEVLAKLACELPEEHDRSLSLWTCAELARALVLQGLVPSISPQTVQRLLADQRLRPWRVHLGSIPECREIKPSPTR